MESSNVFRLKSLDVKEGAFFNRAHVYNKMGAEGENISPELSWSGAPEHTRSFVLTIFDPDAPRPGGWWHWLVFNIPMHVRNLPAGVGSPSGTRLPEGAVEIINDYGAYGYGGPCPPVGDKPHRYQFTLYALDIAVLSLAETATAAELMRLVSKHALAECSFTAYYGR